eukprot:CAMPEP_0197534846 /NCGR_PEP_ID=MMETSP1318-20131121/48521_1 /TAXON_ID=552666 /ORGANISM="Partenskyella glossopodia, Strain RCC365" /LENGTH=111 /DNA_ID=CAMNT_0043092259 /DNA_START=458 /DNA_END=792 /DNA_ORIENTATION=+
MSSPRVKGGGADEDRLLREEECADKCKRRQEGWFRGMRERRLQQAAHAQQSNPGTDADFADFAPPPCFLDYREHDGGGGGRISVAFAAAFWTAPTHVQPPPAASWLSLGHV